MRKYSQSIFPPLHWDKHGTFSALVEKIPYLQSLGISTVELMPVFQFDPQDNEISWLNWKLLDTHSDIFRFFQHMIAFRKAHPSLGRSRFWREDVRWHGVGPEPDRSPHFHSLAFYLDGASQQDQNFYVMINAWWHDLVFSIQEGQPEDWLRVIDTTHPSPNCGDGLRGRCAHPRNPGRGQNPA